MVEGIIGMITLLAFITDKEDTSSKCLMSDV